jgi:hypothetical protein
MAWFRFWNDSSAMPVHIAIEWGGILQHWKNDIPVGGYWEVDVPGIGWHAIQVRPSNGRNAFDPAKDNVFAIANIAVGSVAVVIAAAGIILIPFIAGASTFITGAAIATAIGGGVVTATDIAFAIGDAVVNPVNLSNMYGPDGYNIHIRGGDLIGSFDEATKKFTVNSFQPLLVEWHNNTSNANGVSVA